MARRGSDFVALDTKKPLWCRRMLGICVREIPEGSWRRLLIGVVKKRILLLDVPHASSVAT